MSGRIYDFGDFARCTKCGSEMLSSGDRNFNGPKCKNPSCDGGILEAKYYTKYSGFEKVHPDHIKKWYTRIKIL